MCAVLVTTPAFADPASPTASPADVHDEARPSMLPDLMIGGGTAMLALTVLYHATEFRYVANKLDDATDSTPDPGEYDQYSHTFDTRREVLIGLYAASAITLGAAIYLKRRDAHRLDAQPSVALIPGGGMLTVGWSR
jgi:hypothetical protein